MTDKVYHIYAKNRCLYHSLSKEEFDITWSMIHKFLSIVDGDIQIKDLSYEEVLTSKEHSINSSY